MALIARAAIALIAAASLAACGEGGPPDAISPEPPARAPEIGTAMEMPAPQPFCTFIEEGREPAAGAYVFVTAIGDNVYHGYAQLDGEIERLNEVEAGFGAGMETRRYVNSDESVELEVILLEDGASNTAYTGSVRVIYPVEGEAVKFYGECNAGRAGE